MENFSAAPLPSQEASLLLIQSYIESHPFVPEESLSHTLNIPNYYRLIAEKIVKEKGFTVVRERERVIGLLARTFTEASEKRDDMLLRLNVLHAFE